MTPLYLELENFIGIYSGLGLENIKLDLRTLTEGKTLVALKGDNGKGKSTILDNLQPYRFLPSRASSYSPGAFSFYDHIRNGSSEKILMWIHDDIVYETIFKFRNTGKTKKTEAFLFTYDEECEKEPYIMLDGTKSDGKTAVYDACVEEILGSPELYFTSIFACQGRKSLADYTNGDIKSMLAEMMNMGHIKELGVQAGKVKDQTTTMLESVQEKIRAMDGDKARRNQVSEEAEVWRSRVTSAVNIKKSSHEAVQTAQNVLAKAEADAESGKDVAARRASLADKIKLVEERFRGNKILNTDDTKRASDLRSSAIETYAQDVAKMVQRKNKLVAENTETQSLLSRREDIEVAAKRVKFLTEDAEAVQKKINGLQIRVDEELKLSGERAFAEQQSSVLKRQIDTGETRLVEIQKRAEKIDTVPCEKECSDICFYTEDARKAVTQVDELKANISAYKTQAEDFDRLAFSKGSLIEDLDSPGKEITEKRNDLDNVQTQIKTLQDDANLLAALVNAQSIAEEREREILVLADELTKKEQDHGTYLLESNDHLAELEERRIRTTNEETAELKPLTEELTAMPKTNDVDRVAEAKRVLGSHQEAYDDADLQSSDAVAKVATISAKLQEIDETLATLPSLNKAAETLEDEVGHWTALQKALSNDGIIALAIDDAGPYLSGIANDLLLACYGPRFTVSMKTQVETAKGAMKETFDIRVFDAQENSEKSVKDMSGGERIWILDAITRAIALYLAEINGQTHETLFSDESDGALDPERKLMFIKMKRKVIELGGYTNEIFISHTPELWDLADGSIDLNEYAQ